VLGAGALVTVGGPADERARVAQLIGAAPAPGYLLRSPATLTGAIDSLRGARAAVRWLLPEARVVSNSALPMPANDGALWAGRGVNVLVRGGAAVRAGRVTVVLAPEVASLAEPRLPDHPDGAERPVPAHGPVQPPVVHRRLLRRPPAPLRRPALHPRHAGPELAYVTSGAVAAGVTTENEWWGPGAQTALLLSNAAEGVPRLFVRTRRPLRTRAGDVEARWLLGAPTQSILFDAPEGRESRALSGVAATLRLRADTGLTLGVARLALSSRASGGLLGHALDAVTKYQDHGRGDTLAYPRRVDHLTSVFARWLFPAAGAEAYGEFARTELPRSVRDFLTVPLNAGAFTLGVARAWRPATARVVRVQAELTNLEQTRNYTDRPPPPDFYTGRAAPAGFTSRGQVLGAAVGPGSSSQWLAVDYYGSAEQAGVFVRRTRNQNDALYRNFLANLSRHDVTLSGGVRGGYRLRGLDARLEVAVADRLNYLFQNGAAYTYRIGTVDVRNVSVALDLSPRGPRARR
jgi:hypothetical protein